jgi:hypothetical protein
LQQRIHLPQIKKRVKSTSAFMFFSFLTQR